MTNTTPTLMGSDYRIALLCNAYSTNQEYFARPMGVIIETLFGNQKAIPNGNPGTPLPTAPLSMCILDSLTLHCKMSLIHSIVTHVAKLAQNKSNIPGSNMMAPALVETYSRLLVYTEIESMGIKGFIREYIHYIIEGQKGFKAKFTLQDDCFRNNKLRNKLVINISILPSPIFML